MAEKEEWMWIEILDLELADPRALWIPREFDREDPSSSCYVFNKQRPIQPVRAKDVDWFLAQTADDGSPIFRVVDDG